MQALTFRQTSQMFRILMEAMARPASLHSASLPGGATDMPLILMLCDTLFDHEVSFAVIGASSAGDMEEQVAMVTGARRTKVASADYLLVCGDTSRGAVREAFPGTLEYPDTGATVIYNCARIVPDEGTPFQVSGPGIEQPTVRHISGISADECALIREINGEYPLGIDVIACDERQLFSLPRSTKLEEVRAIARRVKRDQDHKDPGGKNKWDT